MLRPARVTEMPPDDRKEDERKRTTKFPAVTRRDVLIDAVEDAVPSSLVGPRSETPQPSSSLSGRPGMLSFSDLEEPDIDTEVGRRPSLDPDAAPTSTKRDRAALTILTGVNAGQVFPMIGSEATIGRARDAGIRIDDVGISRKHTRVVRAADGRHFVEDLGSTNGTFVAGQRIDRIELTTGDRVQIGPNVVLRFAFLDATEEELARALYEASTRDALTRVFNRRHFTERIGAEVAYAARHKTLLSVLLFDLDHFKMVNDTYGHLAGDVVLRVVAAQVQKTIRVEDLLARYGGEEFVILIRGIEQDKASLFGERVRRAVERLEIPWEGETLRVTISVGVSSLKECGTVMTSETLLLLADERLYGAKDGGRNRVSAK